MADTPVGEQWSATLRGALGRRGFLLASAGVAALGTAACSTAAPAAPAGIAVLQPLATGAPPNYVPATPTNVLWGRLPTRGTRPVATVDNGATVVVDTISHEVVLEDQGRDPVAYFTGQGVAAGDVLTDAAAVARMAPHDGPGPHVITGPIAVRGAEPGHSLAVDVLDLALRVPYGVVSNRHGKGALPGELPEQC